jgi:hypothetical protein
LTASRLPRPSLLLALVLAISTCACATRPSPADPEAVAEFRATNDPIEPLNRASYFVNEGIDTLVLRPAAEAYRIFLPPEVRTAIRNVLANLRTPVILVNDVLQGETQRAGTTHRPLRAEHHHRHRRHLRRGQGFRPARPYLRISARRWRSGACRTGLIFSCPCSARRTRAT